MKPTDHSVRSRLIEQLDQTFLVEAAAGTGKTTVLVERILALFLNGLAHPSGLAALTFTEKAAGEMKLRLRERLEQARATHPRLEEALAHLEEAQIATIHSFCATCLREYPLEAGVDIGFETLDQPTAARFFGEVFELWLQQALEEPPPGLSRYLRRQHSSGTGAGSALLKMAWSLCRWREFRTPWKRPELVRAKEADRLVSRLREFERLRSSCFTPKSNTFCRDTWQPRWLLNQLDLLEEVAGRDYDSLEASLVWLTRDFLEPRKGGRREDYGELVDRQGMLAYHADLAEEIQSFAERCDADLASRLQQELMGAVDAYQAAKAKRGVLDFVDLLVATRNLLAERRSAREQLQRRYTHLFIDEFQDTDPLQAEILFLLAAADPAQNDWRGVEVVPGKLFLVADPKQSIYRFRRADIATYYEVVDKLGRPHYLNTSFRATPAIQRFVNQAFGEVMVPDPQTLQADYVPLAPFRSDHSSQPAVVALSLPGAQASDTSLKQHTPEVVAAFIEWLLFQSGWTVAEGSSRRKVAARDIALLFRRFQSYGDDIVRPYIDALQGRGVESLVVGGRSFHSREEVAVLRVALEAIEWPSDELAVFSTLRGPLFAIDDSVLFLYRQQGGALDPLRPAGDSLMEEVSRPLEFLGSLHRERNRRPVADTLQELLEFTRFHAALVLRPRGEQALANVLGLIERARHYDGRENLSFRGFVELLSQEAQEDDRSEAPILEEGSEGVRMMTVHSAKGLEFPVVVLADPGAPLAFRNPGRHLVPEKKLCLLKLGKLTPLELLDQRENEERIERAEGERLCYVAATRAQDLLVVPALPEKPYDRSWLSPLWKTLYEVPWHSTYQGPLPAVADFRESPVVWCASQHLKLQQERTHGLRQPAVLSHLIGSSTPPERVRAGQEQFLAWQDAHSRLVEKASRPSLVVKGPKEVEQLSSEQVEVIAVEREESRPVGPRFGTLMHEALAVLPLDASQDEIEAILVQKGRWLGATRAEQQAARVALERTLSHPLLERAREAELCRRECPVTASLGEQLVSGVLDLAFLGEGEWSVVDFKTDDVKPEYLRQVAAYGQGVGEATGRPVRCYLMLV